MDWGHIAVVEEDYQAYVRSLRVPDNWDINKEEDWNPNQINVESLCSETRLTGEDRRLRNHLVNATVHGVPGNSRVTFWAEPSSEKFVEPYSDGKYSEGKTQESHYFLWAKLSGSYGLKSSIPTIMIVDKNGLWRPPYDTTDPLTCIDLDTVLPKERIPVLYGYASDVIEQLELEWDSGQIDFAYRSPKNERDMVRRFYNVCRVQFASRLLFYIGRRRNHSLAHIRGRINSMWESFGAPPGYNVAKELQDLLLLAAEHLTYVQIAMGKLLGERGVECPVRRGQIVDTVQLSCSHKFCKRFLEEWTGTLSNAGTCPMCRTAINPDDLTRGHASRQKFSIVDLWLEWADEFMQNVTLSMDSREWFALVLDIQNRFEIATGRHVET